MKQFNEHDRLFANTRFVFLVKTPEAAELQKGAEAVEAKLFDNPSALAEMKPKELAAEVRRRLEEQFPSKNYNDKAEYEKVMTESIQRIEARILEYRKQIEKDGKAVSDDRAKIRAELENSQAVEAASLKLNEPEAENAKDLFLEELLPALNKKYMNLEQQTDEYKTLASEFQKNVKANLESRLDSILNKGYKKEELKTQLITLRDELRNETYEANSNQDGILDLGDLRILKSKGMECVRLADMLNGFAGKEELLATMKSKDFFARKEMIEASGQVADALADQVEKDGADAKFIEAVRKRAPNEAVEDFNDARKVFKEMLKKETEAGLEQGMALVREVNAEVFGDSLGFKTLEDAPEVIRGMVERERQYLLSPERTRSQNFDDENVVRFMQGSRAEREAMLTDGVSRDLLFQSIKNIQARSLSKEWGEQISKLPKSADKLTTGYAVDKPTGHDILARHLAIVALTSEAEWTINNLSATEIFKGQDLAGDLEKTDAESRPPTANYNFTDTQKKRDTRYVSEIERAGLNTRDIGLGLLQVWGAITLVLNIKANWEKGKLDELPERLLKNPFAWASFAAAVGPSAYRRNPEVTRLIGATPGEWERIMQNFSFVSLAKSKNFGPTLLRDFMEGPEIEVMSKIKDPTGKALQKVLNEAGKRKPPALEKADLEGLMGEDEDGIRGKELAGQLPESSDKGDKAREKARYLFYQKFQTANAIQLRENYRKWSGGA